MTAVRRIASVLSGVALGFGLIAVAAPTAQATKAAQAEHTFDCDGSSASEQAQANKTPNSVDGDHPSGQEGKGEIEPGGSGTQGKSDSDPDGDSNLGADKPDPCTGGFDEHDRDGNNGCGNDHDFEDDNNGNCGGKTDQAAQVQSCHDNDKIRHEAADDSDADDESKADHESKCPESDDTVTAAGTAARVEAAVSAAAAPGTTVAGAVEVAGNDTTTPTTAGTQVLGITETRPDALARTGAGLAGLVAAAGACFGGGRLFGLARRRLGS